VPRLVPWFRALWRTHKPLLRAWWWRPPDQATVSGSVPACGIRQVQLDEGCPGGVAHRYLGREGDDRDARPDGQQQVSSVDPGGTGRQLDIPPAVAGHVDFKYQLVYPDGRAVPVRRTGLHGWQTVSAVMSMIRPFVSRISCPSLWRVVNIAPGYARETHLGMTCSGGAFDAISFPQNAHRRTR
jgi:hypothetical protein